jgi:hypothetical protein
MFIEYSVEKIATPKSTSFLSVLRIDLLGALVVPTRPTLSARRRGVVAVKGRAGLVGVLTVAALVGGIASAAPAAASTTVSVTGTFAEPSFFPGCTVTFGFCGHGVLKPFGSVTEMIEFNACGDLCDLRTINLANGTIFARELELPSGISGMFIGGTGDFVGASGTYSASVRFGRDPVERSASQVTLTGTLTYGA